MNAAEHSAVWQDATDRLRKASKQATKDGEFAVSVALDNSAALTEAVAAAYREHAKAK